MKCHTNRNLETSSGV